ncbi:MAG: diguanylate cyclase [Gammaproteobacteria bacterium]|nr:diguanylate cyclase [Gammaproteobacteria bacterium]MBU1481918.1 diguanylate cyclase [Gammaproteobacteria bacterium]
MRSIVRNLLIMLCLGGIISTSFAAAKTVEIGVLAFRPKQEMSKKWQPLGKALKRAIPQHDFRIVALDYPELEQAVSERRVDFVLTNPAHFVLLSRRLGLSAPLATLIVEEHGIPLTSFGGVIFALAERTDLKQLSDLKGKRLVAPELGSFGGYQMQAYELALAGVHLPGNAVLQIVGMPHDNAVNAVLDGSADAGFVRTGLLESMTKEHKLDLTKIKILNQQNIAKLPLLLSTRLYPEWAFAAMPHVDENISRRVAATLFQLEEDTATTHAIGIRGFTTPSDYSPVEELQRELRLPPFDSTPKFTLHDVWTRYYWESISAVCASLVILLLAASLLLMNRNLKTKSIKLENEVRLRHGLLDALGEGVYGVDYRGRCIFINPAALLMLGFSENEIIGNDQHALFHHHHPDGSVYPGHDCPVFRSLADDKTRSGEEWFWRKDGSCFQVAITVSPNWVEGGSKGAVVVFHDITERKLNDERIRHMAQHDTLTDLPNRALLTDRLQQALSYAKRDKQRVALMFVDLDHFKPINDTLGHIVGDWLLKQVATRMRECVRDSDTVARVGGDEFVVLLRSIDSTADAVMVAEKIRNALNKPFDLAQQSLHISCSIGMALYPEHAEKENELLDFADIAMYQAKQLGRDKVQVFSSIKS